jgi:hypothetical protein
MTESPPKKIIIVEDHPLFCAMLTQLINNEPGMTVCGETDNIQDAMTIIIQGGSTVSGFAVGNPPSSEPTKPTLARIFGRALY